MENQCIICVAITGSVPKKSDNSSVPISISEQVESTHQSFEIGASIVHCHVRNKDESPSSDPEKFLELRDKIRTYCPGMIIQFSTGGRSGTGKQRGGMLYLKPDMASITVGSNNFPNRVYANSPQLVDWLASEIRFNKICPEIEIFDLSQLFQAAKMLEDGRFNPNPYVQFVMGVSNAMPADKDVFRYYVKTVRRLLPDSQWCGAGIGKAQSRVNEWCIKMGGHVRTGLEDNIRLNKNTLAPSNAALVQKTVDLCRKYSRPVATCAEARVLLNI